MVQDNSCNFCQMDRLVQLDFKHRIRVGCAIRSTDCCQIPLMESGLGVLDLANIRMSVHWCQQCSGLPTMFSATTDGRNLHIKYGKKMGVVI